MPEGRTLLSVLLSKSKHLQHLKYLSKSPTFTNSCDYLSVLSYTSPRLYVWSKKAVLVLSRWGKTSWCIKESPSFRLLKEKLWQEKQCKGRSGVTLSGALLRHPTGTPARSPPTLTYWAVSTRTEESDSYKSYQMRVFSVRWSCSTVKHIHLSLFSAHSHRSSQPHDEETVEVIIFILNGMNAMRTLSLEPPTLYCPRGNHIVQFSAVFLRWVGSCVTGIIALF